MPNPVPIEQTPAWTFDLALAVFKKRPQGPASAALDDFLLHNKDVLLLPAPLGGSSDTKGPEFTLRGVLYTGATPEILKCASQVAQAANIDPKEAARIVLRVIQRRPMAHKPAETLAQGASEKKGPATTELALSLTTHEQKTPGPPLHYVAAAYKERRTILALAAECFAARSDLACSLVARNLGRLLASTPDYALGLVAALEQLAKSLAEPALGPLDRLRFQETLLHMNCLLQLLHDVFLVSPVARAAATQPWFALMRDSAFAHNWGTHITSQETFAVLHALVTVILVQLLGVDKMPAAKEITETASSDLAVSVPTQNSLPTSPESFALISSVATSTNNVVVAYAWLVVAYRKAIVLEEYPDTYQNFLAKVPLADVKDTVVQLSSKLAETDIFAEIHLLSSLLLFDNVYVLALVDLILAALPLAAMTPSSMKHISLVLRNAPNSSVEKFFADSEARAAIIVARAKFPEVLTPYLYLAAINGNFALHDFKELHSYMSILDQDAFSRNHEIDTDDTELVRILRPIDLYPPFELNNKLSLLLSSGTRAKILSTIESKVVVTFLHDYNGWAFLGRIVENISKSFGDESKLEVLSCTLDILVAAADSDASQVHQVLDYMSAYTDEEDILGVLFRLFEQSMHVRNVELLEKFLDVFSKLLPAIPARVWPFLATLSLLPNGGKEGFASILFGSIEMLRGDYLFTSSLIKFVFVLAENCLSLSSDYPKEAKSEILASFTEHLIMVFEHFSSCKFRAGVQRLELCVLILDIFTQILETVHLIGPGRSPEAKPTKVFAKSASLIIHSFVVSSNTRSLSLILNPIDLLASPEQSYDACDISGFFVEIWVQSALIFTKLLVTIRSATNTTPSEFERELFRKLPQIVSIYSQGGLNRKVILDLLAALTSGQWEANQMPSILAHLGRDNSRILLHSLVADLENPFDDYAIKISIYDFLCCLMEANQEGLAVLLISGRDIFGEMSKDEELYPKPISLLAILKKNISDITTYPLSVTVHLLDAVALALNSWTTVRSDDSDVQFVNELIKQFEKFEKNEADLVEASYQCKVHAKITEILSLVLFTTKNESCVSTINKLMTSASFISKLPAQFTISNYEPNLRHRVHEQFQNVFLTDLHEFEVAIKKRNRFGPSAVYDLLLLDSLYQSQPQWKELRPQIVHLSTSLQYYNTQIALLKAIGALLTTFCRRSPKMVSKQYAELVHQLLLIEEPLDDYSKMFASQQYLERYEISFLILNTMKDELDAATLNGVLGVCTSCLRESEHKKSLTRLSYVVLSRMPANLEIVGTTAFVFREFFDLVIAKGMKTIIMNLQNDVYLSHTTGIKKVFGENLDDCRLVLSILKVYLLLPFPKSLKGEILESLDAHDTIAGLCSLYSFSHLVLVNEEPVFAQLSMMFVQQLLGIEKIFDKLEKANLFMVIRESMISEPLRKGGVSPKAQRQVHRNWTNGILPIIVTCLSQGEMLGEAILTLRVFARQIESCVESWARDLSSLQVSSAVTFETMQLLYIYRLLAAASAAEGITVASPEAVDMSVLPGLETQQKREDFSGFIGNLLKHPKFLASRILPSSAEEEALLKADQELFAKDLIGDILELREFLV